MYLYYTVQIFQVLIINKMLELCMQKSDVFSTFSCLYAIFLNFCQRVLYIFVSDPCLLYDLIMVSHAVWKTWPEGLCRQKPRPKAEVFVVTEARGPCFSHGIGDHDQILL